MIRICHRQTDGRTDDDSITALWRAWCGKKYYSISL